MRFNARVLPVLALLAFASPASAADITAEQSALVYDLLSSQVPAGPDQDILSRAMGVLKEEKLAGAGSRPYFVEKGLLDRYGKALFLGNRAKEFAPEIGRIRDLVSRGDRKALEKALSELWVKSGRAEPDSKALEPVVASLYGAAGQEPEETVRHVIDKPNHRVEIIHARAGGKIQVDVTAKNAEGAETERTVFQGVTETMPTKDGMDLQRRIKLERVCTNTPETDKEMAEALNGAWNAKASGEMWNIEQDGEKIALSNERAKDGPLNYTGTFRLGRINATHVINKVTDMGDELPLSVRSQLTGGNVSFRVYLELCANKKNLLDGTWSSQHVTYNGMSMEVSRIHDPYDLSLTLTRGAGEKVAQGASKEELP